jgi:DNA topoisomerase-1
MSKSLVIVESPAKAKTINKYLGDDFVVKSSVGHIRDLPTSGSSSTTTPAERAKEAAKTRKLSPEKKAIHKVKKAREQLVRRMGVDPDHDWAARYQILPGKEKVVSDLRKAAKDAPTIYLATDLDREGEAIAWHLREAIGGDEARYRRVVFNEITKKAIDEAFLKPGELNIDRVNAQQARRFLDRVVGFMLSPLLWKKVARGLSAGRVQSVAVKLIVDREKQIRAFIPDEYWTLHADLLAQDASEALRFEVVQRDGKKFRPVSQSETQQSVDLLAEQSFKITQREDKPSSSKPSAPFITSTLQQAASTRLGYSVKKTMTMAQRLYEAGHITYMRTDSTNLSADSVAECRQLVEKDFGSEYLPDEPIRYSSRDGAQEAHEAIRPSQASRYAATLIEMETDARRLYELIWQQFVACQMVPAEFLVTRVEVEVAGHKLRINGRVVKFAGYQKVMPPAGSKEEDRSLPDMQVGQILNLEKLDPNQHFTKPPARFSEAALVKELEKCGIGRPSTYASIISTIQDRGYVRLDKRRFYAEKMGEIVSERLTENFADLMDYSFTARMEQSLDKIAEGELDWKQTLSAFYKGFAKQLEQADADMRLNEATDTDIVCDNCGRHMMVRTGTTGVFLGCSGYGLPPAERCKKTMNLAPGDEAVEADADDEAESRQLKDKHRCSKCNTAMDSYLVDETRKLHVCGNNPDCDGFEVETGTFKIKGYEGPSLDCDKCGHEMQLKTGRFGKYFGCTSEDCKNTRKLLRNGQAAPPKMDPVPMPELLCEKVEDHYLLRDGASGLFLAASQYPRHRETRAPLLKELLAHREEVDPKYEYLMSAPQIAPDDNDVVIRFDKKAGQSYVRGEKAGKPAGWRADYIDNKWVEKKSGK